MTDTNPPAAAESDINDFCPRCGKPVEEAVARCHWARPPRMEARTTTGAYPADRTTSQGDPADV